MICPSSSDDWVFPTTTSTSDILAHTLTTQNRRLWVSKVELESDVRFGKGRRDVGPVLSVFEVRVPRAVK